jgi:hypothetical protein
MRRAHLFLALVLASISTTGCAASTARTAGWTMIGAGALAMSGAVPEIANDQPVAAAAIGVGGLALVGVGVALTTVKDGTDTPAPPAHTEPAPAVRRDPGSYGLPVF